LSVEAEESDARKYQLESPIVAHAAGDDDGMSMMTPWKTQTAFQPDVDTAGEL